MEMEMVELVMEMLLVVTMEMREMMEMMTIEVMVMAAAIIMKERWRWL